MNYKKKSILFFAAIVFLGLGVFFTIYLYVGGGTKEVKAAKHFIWNVYDHDIVDKSENKDQIVFESSIKNGVASSEDYYSVTTRDFGIDVDDNYNIIGFSNKVSKNGEVKISTDEARVLAEKYLKYIYKGEYEFKEFANDDNATPYYSVIFVKYKDDYPFYGDQLMVGIDKSTGKLDSYSNGTFQGKPKKVHVNISTEEAEQVVLNAFSQVYTSVEIIDSTYKAYCDNNDMSTTELCYVVTIKGNDIDNKETKFKYFVTTDEGEIINTIKDTVSKTVA